MSDSDTATHNAKIMVKHWQGKRNRLASVLDSIPASLKDDTTTNSQDVRNGEGRIGHITIREGITGYWESDKMHLQFDINGVDGFTRNERRYVLRERDYDPDSFTVPDGLPSSVKAFIDGKAAFKVRVAKIKAREKQEKQGRAEAWARFAKLLPPEYVLPKAHSGKAWSHDRVDIEYVIDDNITSVLSAYYDGAFWTVVKAVLVLRHPDSYAVGVFPRLAEASAAEKIVVSISKMSSAVGVVCPDKT